MDLPELREQILLSTYQLRLDRAEIAIIVRVGYWVARYSCGWTKEMSNPTRELVLILDTAHVPPNQNPHVRLLHFVVREVTRATGLIPPQRAPLESKWFSDLASELIEQESSLDWEGRWTQKD